MFALKITAKLAATLAAAVLVYEAGLIAWAKWG